MLKKKNNLICFIAIIISIITGTVTINSFTNQLKDSSNIKQLNSNYPNNNTDQYDYNTQEPVPFTSNNASTQNISLDTISIIIVCTIIFSLAVVYLIMSKLATQNIFVNHDKKVIYVLTTSLLSIAIICTSFITLYNLQQNSLLQQDNNQVDNSIIDNNRNYFSV
ncbi:hypothetical protein [Thomasclavelia sp.]